MRHLSSTPLRLGHGGNPPGVVPLPLEEERLLEILRSVDARKLTTMTLTEVNYLKRIGHLDVAALHRVRLTANGSLLLAALEAKYNDG